MTPLFAADVAPAVDSWVLPLIQGLFSLLLSVVGLYLASVVKGLREEMKRLREQYETLAKDFTATDKVVAAMAAACAERHGQRQPALGGG